MSLEESPVFLRWVGIGLSAIGLAMFLFGIYFVVLGDEVGGWPSTEGTIVDTRIRVWSPVRATFEEQRLKGDITQHYPEIEYRWTVDGRTYEGDRYKLGTTHPKYDERDDARQAALRFSPGDRITIYYDPDAPDQAVLDPSKDWFALLTPSVLSLVFVGTGFLLQRLSPAMQAAVERNEAKARARRTSGA